MARGIVHLPLEKGKKELTWYVGRAEVNGSNDVSPVVQLRINRDADFVAKRLWMVEWPNAGAALPMPIDTSLLFRDGGTQRALSLSAGYNRIMALDADPARSMSAFLGLPSPFLIRNNSNLFGELNVPSRAVTPWAGDVFIVAEGFKVYPGVPESIPRTIEAYSIPFNLNSNLVVIQPQLGVSNTLNGQIATITNNGEGKFLAKQLVLQIVDDAGLDVTAAILRDLGIQITDTTSGTKDWIQDQTPLVGQSLCPASIMTMHNAFLPFNTPRYIDENGIVQMRFVFSPIAASLARLAAAATWPVTISCGFIGSLMPR